MDFDYEKKFIDHVAVIYDRSSRIPWKKKCPFKPPSVGKSVIRERVTSIINGRLECGRTQLKVSEELGIVQSVISRLRQRFQDDGNVSRCYSTGRPRVTTPNEGRYIFGSYCQKKQTEHSIRLVSSALFSYRYDSFKADRVQTLRAHWSIGSQACHMCSTYRNSLSPAMNLE
ncbi:uncharacterized protein TNCV_870271 [Trichonephila clavipes]|nr:uncharacterized protein TNCV_870271 [Trichonephila clavipes]